jgi:hypothetical protein
MLSKILTCALGLRPSARHRRHCLLRLKADFRRHLLLHRHAERCSRLLPHHHHAERCNSERCVARCNWERLGAGPVRYNFAVR